MLSVEIQDQLRQVFAKLENEVVLVVDASENQSQQELSDMLLSLAQTSEKIKIEESGDNSPVPRFTIKYKNKDTGIEFKGVPGGHEFTSLVLAILNTDSKGKLPDEGLQARIKRLNGPIRLQTFISLTCENCPEVVQALNQMALLHPEFKHTMVDGAFVQDDVQKIGIQGVPSIVVDGKIIHSGRIDFLDLLVKLENHFGQSEPVETSHALPKDLGHFDVVVIGGGPAGVSSAIYTVRKGLKTAILCEKIGGQVKETKGIENLISTIYTEGPRLAEDMYKHLTSYPVELFERRRVQSISEDKVIQLEGGEKLSADSIIVATGAKWRELNVPGEKNYIGRGVAYCPHCDGPFYKGKKIVVVGGGNSGVEAAIDLAGIAGEVTVLEFNEALKADKILIDKLNSFSNTKVITNAKTRELKGDGQKIIAIDYEDRRTEKVITLPVDGVFVQIGLVPNSSFLKDTVELTKYGEVVVDPKGRTSKKGIYAAGDVTTTPFKQIVIAMGEGAKTALTVFEDRMFAG